MRYLKRLFIIMSSLFILCGCVNAFRDELEDIHSEIDELKSRLEAVLSETNENIKSLRVLVAALQDSDFVTDIKEIEQDGKQAGYVITFSKSGQVRIYHGADGTDGTNGTNGEDGQTPYIGSNGDWWIGGTDTGVKAAGSNGTDGTNGTNGEDGQTPYIGSNGDWWIGGTDTGVKATGSNGADGNNGSNGVNGHTPVIGVGKDTDGLWYWTVDNDWLLDNTGNKVRVVGIDGKNGNDGHTPVIGVGKDTDGLWYWTVDNDWLLDSAGKKVRVVGVDGNNGSDGFDGHTPVLGVSQDTDGSWYWTIDNNWLRDSAGGKVKAVDADGSGGDSVFKGVDVSNSDYIIITLADGTVLNIPRYSQKFDISFDVDADDAAIGAGETLPINYTLSGGSSKLMVTASSDGHFKTKVKRVDDTSGIIYVTCPAKYADGYINVIVSDDAERAVVKVINFYERRIIFANGLEYNVSEGGGQLVIPVSLNFDQIATVSSDASSWLSIAQGTKADMKDETITVSASANETFSMRKGIIYIYSRTNSETPFAEITINQSSANFSVDVSNYAVKYEGDIVKAAITSSVGLTFKIPDGCDWLSTAISSSGDNGYTLTATVSPNRTASKRNAEIQLYNGNSSLLLGAISIVQVSQEEEDPDDMVFVVRVNFVNDFTAYLPLSGNVNCYVDWGDGSVEHYSGRFQDNGNWVKHAYNVSEPKSFSVSVSGSVTSLNSSGIPFHTVTEVRQWGNTGLTSMYYAFAGSTILTAIATDETGAFEKVTDFACAFSDCSSLNSVPEGLFSNCSNVTIFAYVFSGWSSLASVPESLFSNCPNVTNFDGVFKKCSSLTSVPEGLFRNCSDVTRFESLFEGCSSLTSVPGGLFSDCRNVTNFKEGFSACSSLTSIPENLFSNCPNITSFHMTFTYCRSLTGIPSGLFDNNRKVEDFLWTFAGCGNITGESPYTVINGVKCHLYERENYPDYFVRPTMFQLCLSSSGFTDYNNIPDSWKK